AANREAFRRRQEAEECHRVANNAFHQLPNLDALLSALDDPALRPGFVEGLVSALMRVAVALNALGANPAILMLDAPPHENKEHMLYALEVLVAACDKGETETRQLLEMATKSPDLACSVVRHLRNTIPEQLLCKKTPSRANSQAAKNVEASDANQSDEQDKPPTVTPPGENFWAGDSPAQSGLTPDQRQEAIRNLQPAVRKAYLACEYA